MKKLKVKNMSNFQLSSHIDANKVFLRKRSELENRLDPHQYHPERLGSIETLVKNNKCVKLRNCSIFRNVVTNNMSENDIYIGLENIESNTGKYVPNDQKSSISSANIFKKGQILFPKLRPYLNKVYQAEFDGICSTEFHILNADDGFLDEFLAIYLRSNIIVNQTKHLMTGNTLPRLQTQDIYNLPVPVISIVKQREIVSIYNKVNSIKQQKEQEAQNLLDSIDDYLMKELDIELPEIDNSLESRVFQTTFSEITGKKFDAFGTKNYLNKMKSRKYEEINLSSVAYLEKGISITSNSISSGKYPVIAGGKSSPYNHNEYNHIGNVITISASGAYAGFVWYHSNPIFASDCTKVFSKDEKQITTPYIYEILKLKQQDIYNLQVGAGQPHVYSSDLSKILIPLVDFKIQNKIVAHIQSIREQAKQLQNDAQQQFEEAKKEIERMILGER